MSVVIGRNGAGIEVGLLGRRILHLAHVGSADGIARLGGLARQNLLVDRDRLLMLEVGHGDLVDVTRLLLFNERLHLVKDLHLLRGALLVEYLFGALQQVSIVLDVNGELFDLLLRNRLLG